MNCEKYRRTINIYTSSNAHMKVASIVLYLDLCLKQQSMDIYIVEFMDNLMV